MRKKPHRYIGGSILDTEFDDDQFGTLLSSAAVESYLVKSEDVFERALREMVRITASQGRIITTTGIQYIPPETVPPDEYDELEASFGKDGAIYVLQDTDVHNFDKYLERLANHRSALEKLMQEGLVQPDGFIRHQYPADDLRECSTSLVLEVL